MLSKKYKKFAPVNSQVNIFLFLHYIPIDSYQFWPPNAFMTLSNQTTNEKKVRNLTLISILI